MDSKNLPTVAEASLNANMQTALKARMRELQRSETVGSMGSVRASVLSSVVGENYEQAINNLREYVDDRAAFPHFQDRAERWVDHACVLIRAVESKRNVPNAATMSMSKQQELHERVLAHFEELKQNLQQIERLERDHHLSDIRSTVWVIYALCAVGLAILGALFAGDVRSGLMSSTLQAADTLLEAAGDALVNHIPFL